MITIAVCMLALYACDIKQEYGNDYIYLTKDPVSCVLSSTYFDLEDEPDPNEPADTTLNIVGVFRSGVAVDYPGVDVELFIDSVYIKDMIARYNDPDTEKDDELLWYKDAAVLPAGCYTIESLKGRIGKNERIISFPFTLHKLQLTRLDETKHWIIPFRIRSAGGTVNNDLSLCRVDVRIKRPEYTYHNIATGKPASTSDNANANYYGALAVDGDTTTNASRWVSDALNGEHWIEVDLQEDTRIYAFKTWIGYNGYGNAIKEFSFQAWTGGQWETLVSGTNNTEPVYFSDFEAVTTGKVRFLVPPYTGNQVRMFEIAVYTMKKK